MKAIRKVNYRGESNHAEGSSALNYHGVTYYYTAGPWLEQHIFSRYYNANFPVLRKLVQYLYFRNRCSSSIIR